ncbi:MAG: T9SS type A sorting domain-containing protein [Calditrichaeota bacterium]|nr:T9SS type A sorting domain-containing protein [Calditrichota bacterium]
MKQKWIWIWAMWFAFVPLKNVTADVWIPPAGELINDSLFVDLHFIDGYLEVSMRSVHYMHKFISDDYLLRYRTAAEQLLLDRDNITVSCSDSLNDPEIEDNGFEVNGISRTVLEDTVRFEQFHTFSSDNDNDRIGRLTFLRLFNRLDYLFEFIPYDGFPIFEGGRSSVQINANQQIDVSWQVEGFMESVHELEGSNSYSFDIFPRDEYGDITSSELSIDFRNQYRNEETIIDSLSFVLTPETRAETPGLIKTEDIRICLGSQGSQRNLPDVYYYNQSADIELHSDITNRLAPMWLWYPNDVTEAEVTLNGIECHSGFGGYSELPYENDLECREVNEEHMQNGFFIFIPMLVNDLEGQGEWWMDDIHLRINIRGQTQEHSARFIVITAPTDPSRIEFRINSAFNFLAWTNPYEEYESVLNGQSRSMVFTGNCPCPGIAEVSWDLNGVLSDQTPLPHKIDLQAFPNPFNSTTTITYGLPVQSDVSLQIFNTHGQLVDVLVDHEMQVGMNSIEWNANGQSAGIYFVRLIETKGRQIENIEKVILIK